eukprot:7358326-Lingulodinium_polyedra.AAC.1
MERSERGGPRRGGLPAQARWARRALRDGGRELLDLVADSRRLGPGEWAERLYGLHQAMGDPETRCPELVADVAAYERMASRVRDDVAGEPSRAVPRR